MTIKQTAAWLERKGFQPHRSIIDTLMMPGIQTYRKYDRDTLRLATSFDFTEDADTSFPFWRELSERIGRARKQFFALRFEVVAFRTSERFVKLDDTKFHAHYAEGGFRGIGMVRADSFYVDRLKEALKHLGCQPPSRATVIDPKTLDLGFEAASDDDHTLLKLTTLTANLVDAYAHANFMDEMAASTERAKEAIEWFESLTPEERELMRQRLREAGLAMESA